MFPEKSEARPIIYAYEYKGVESHKGYIKIGYTTRTAQERVKEQNSEGRVPYRILGEWSALRDDGTQFTDATVRDVLKKCRFRSLFEGEKEGRNEWIFCEVKDVARAVLALQTGHATIEDRTQNFKLRDEQRAAIEKTLAYYKSAKRERTKKAPKFLWNAKMRFGKTFAAYKLAQEMKAKRVLVLTFKPAVGSAWREDLMTHIDFEGWQFLSRPEMVGGYTIDEQYQNADKKRPIVCFGSFQDFLGLENGAIKEKNEWVHEINWDLVVFDEYHFGAWRDNAKHLFAMDEDLSRSVRGGASGTSVMRGDKQRRRIGRRNGGHHDSGISHEAESRDGGASRLRDRSRGGQEFELSLQAGIRPGLTRRTWCGRA